MVITINSGNYDGNLARCRVVRRLLFIAAQCGCCREFVEATSHRPPSNIDEKQRNRAIGRRRPQRAEMEGRLRTKTHQIETVSRLRARAALSPPWRPILGDWTESLPRGAAERLSFEDECEIQNEAISFEDDSQFRPPEDPSCPNGQNGSPEGR